MSREASDHGRRPGFTLVELLIAMAVFVMAIAVTAPFFASFQRTASLETHAQDLTQMLRRAQHRSITGQRGTMWGVHVEEGKMILFAGENFAARLPQFDEVHVVRGPYVFSGSGEAVFAPVTGAVQLGPATFFLTAESDEVRITAEREGVLSRSGFGS